MTLRAVLFDFDGVIADTEPIHFRMFQQVFEEEGIILSKDDYYQNYLGLDDRQCFSQVFRDRGKVLEESHRQSLVERKNKALLESIQNGTSLLLPGAKELIESVSGRYFTAIVSGALKNEIRSILTGAKLLDHFQVIVGADDVAQGKPHPEGFLMAIRLLNRDFVAASEILLPGECLVIEDSPWGITAGHEAGAKCAAVLTSYTKDKVSEADYIAQSLKSISWESIQSLFVE